MTTFGHIQVFDTATGAPIDIGDTDALMPAGKLVTHPEWSPNGRRVVFTLYSARWTRTAARARSPTAVPKTARSSTLELDPTTGRATGLRQHRGRQRRRRAVALLSELVARRALAGDGGGAARDVGVHGDHGAAAAGVGGRSTRQTCPGATCLRAGARVARDGGVVDVAEAQPVLAGERSAAVRHVQLEDRLRLRAGEHRARGRCTARSCGWRRSICAASSPGGDPSLPPFWLPFQDITETNHLPFWTAQVACTSDGVAYAHCGADEVCEAGACKVVVP